MLLQCIYPYKKSFGITDTEIRQIGGIFSQNRSVFDSLVEIYKIFHLSVGKCWKFTK